MHLQAGDVAIPVVVTERETLTSRSTGRELAKLTIDFHVDSAELNSLVRQGVADRELVLKEDLLGELSNLRQEVKRLLGSG